MGSKTCFLFRREDIDYLQTETADMEKLEVYHLKNGLQVTVKTKYTAILETVYDTKYNWLGVPVSSTPRDNKIWVGNDDEQTHVSVLFNDRSSYKEYDRLKIVDEFGG